MLLVIHYLIGDVQDSQVVSASTITCVVSGGALNCTHSLAPLLAVVCVENSAGRAGDSVLSDSISGRVHSRGNCFENQSD